MICIEKREGLVILVRLMDARNRKAYIGMYH